MEDKAIIETTPTSIYYQPLEKNRKIKTALNTNNQWKTKQKQKQHQQVFTNSHQKTILTTNIQWKTKHKQKQQQQVFTNSHKKKEKNCTNN